MTADKTESTALCSETKAHTEAVTSFDRRMRLLIAVTAGQAAQKDKALEWGFATHVTAGQAAQKISAPTASSRVFVNAGQAAQKNASTASAINGNVTAGQVLDPAQLLQLRRLLNALPDASPTS